MGDEYGLFWDDLGNDRLYSASSMETWLKPFYTTGVFQGHLQVLASTGMNVIVGSGYANVNGKVIFLQSSTQLTLNVASGISNRIDAIVLERNDADRIITLKVVTGEIGTEPVAPTPVRENNIYQLVLAYIYVGKGVTEINQSNITDTRLNSNLCGWVAGTVTQIDFGQITAQFNSWLSNYINTLKAWQSGYVNELNSWAAGYKAELRDFENTATQQYLDWYGSFSADSEQTFEAWLRNLQDQLDDNQAGHLQNQIDEINTDIERMVERGIVYDSLLDAEREQIFDSVNNPLKATTVFVKLAEAENQGGE